MRLISRQLYYFCPEHQNEHRFLQHYLGHLLEEQGKHLPNVTATQHYFHYQLVNAQGKRLTARGLKVMVNGVEPAQPNFYRQGIWEPYKA